MKVMIKDNAGGYATYGLSLSDSPDWTTMDLAWTDFTQADTALNLTKTYSIRFDIMSGAATGTGTVYLDEIVFMGAPSNTAVVNGLNHGVMASATRLAKANGIVTISVVGLDGKLVAKYDRAVKPGMTVGADLGNMALSRGTYLVRMNGAGISYETKLVK